MNLLFALTLLLPPNTMPSCVAGCSCAQERDVLRAKEKAAVVIEAVALDSTFNAPVTDSSQGFVTVRLTVGQTWKGEFSDTIRVVTSDPGAACGFNFAAGERYLVFAYGTPSGELEVSSCGPSVLWAEAKRARQKLGRPLGSGAA